MNDLVSIITPSYNTSSYISYTIQSVIEQTYTNWEMIIVDDCSTDNTDEIVESFLFDKRIKYIKNSKNIGAALSRNKALKEAKGRWIAFLDSDDLWKPDKLEKQISFMINNDYHFSYTNYSEIDDDGSSKGIMWTGPKTIGKYRMKLFNYMGCLTVMYDYHYVGLIQISDLKKRNDYALWIKVSEKCKAYLLNDNLAYYRVRSSGSLMNRRKSPLNRMKFNYELWHISENKNAFISFVYTSINLIFGFAKKIIYKKRIN